MIVGIINGDIAKSNEKNICHQVNCQGRMKSGVAAVIREKWPTIYEDYVRWIIKSFPNTLGTVGISKQDDDVIIYNFYAQYDYGYDNKRYTSYDAFWECLNRLKHYLPIGSRIAFPYKIGCGLGGANWNIIYAMIDEVLKDYDVVFYKLMEEKTNDKA